MKPLEDFVCSPPGTDFGLQPRLREPASKNCSITEFRDGISSIVTSYDTFLIDQWGVLHDGVRPYPDAVECLSSLRKAGKTILLISNSGRHTDENESRLSRIGFSRSDYDHLVSSGQVVLQMMQQADGDFRCLQGKRCLLLASDGESASAAAPRLPVIVVESVSEADFILLAGYDDALGEAFYQDIVEQALTRNLPMICSNPDLMRITATGLKPGTGYVAKQLQRVGGRVRFIGKPFPEIYWHCLELAKVLKTDRVLAIGDSLQHDVVGGRSAGIDTLLVMGGVHAASLLGTRTPDTMMNRLENLTGASGPLPDWAVPFFAWK